MRRVFMSETGLRAGWRFLIWLAIGIAVLIGLQAAVVWIFRPGEHAFLDSLRLMLGDLLALIAAAVATFVMMRIERRTLRDYLLADTRVLRPQLLDGIAVGNWRNLAVHRSDCPLRRLPHYWRCPARISAPEVYGALDCRLVCHRRGRGVHLPRLPAPDSRRWHRFLAGGYSAVGGFWSNPLLQQAI